MEWMLAAMLSHTPARRDSRKRRWFFSATAGGALLVLLLLAAPWLLPLPAAPSFTPIPESIKVVDRQGRLLYDSAGPADAHQTPIDLSDVPPSLRGAVVATEDAAFYRHAGIDLKAVARAAFDSLVHLRLRSGASTISQQLARNL